MVAPPPHTNNIQPAEVRPQAASFRAYTHSAYTTCPRGITSPRTFSSSPIVPPRLRRAVRDLVQSSDVAAPTPPPPPPPPPPPHGHLLPSGHGGAGAAASCSGLLGGPRGSIEPRPAARLVCAIVMGLGACWVCVHVANVNCQVVPLYHHERGQRAAAHPGWRALPARGGCAAAAAVAACHQHSVVAVLAMWVLGAVAGGRVHLRGHAAGGCLGGWRGAGGAQGAGRGPGLGASLSAPARAPRRCRRVSTNIQHSAGREHHVRVVLRCCTYVASVILCSARSQVIPSTM